MKKPLFNQIERYAYRDYPESDLGKYIRNEIIRSKAIRHIRESIFNLTDPLANYIVRLLK